MKECLLINAIGHMNKIEKSLLILLFFLCLGLIWGFFVVQRAKNDQIFRQELVYWARKTKNIVYWEATTHNPSGDMLPDQIDDNIIGEIRKIFD
jgi:hypothetical protein